MPRVSRLFIKRMRTKIQDIIWDEINQAFAPFAGTCLYAIRAETFFHFALRVRQPNSFRLKNIFYPAAVAWRSRLEAEKGKPSAANPYFFVCDYSAEPGLGTLMPLFKSCDGPATLVVNSQVLTARRGELARQKNIDTICADSILTQKKSQWRSLWRRAKIDLLQFEESLPLRLRPLARASWRVLRT